MATALKDDERTETIGLVLAAQSGDREALGDLIERYQRHVFGIALKRLNNYAEAQELCQDVFLQAMQKIGQLRDPASFGGWLRAITHRMAVNRRLRRHLDVSVEPATLDGNLGDSPSPLADVLQNERSSQLHAGLRRLGELDRRTLEAFYVEGQSLLEMSTAFDAPLGTIKRRLHVARKRLAKEVDMSA